MLPLPAAAVTEPPVQVPVTAAPLATRPAGRVSVKLKVCVGLVAGWVTVKVRLTLPATVRLPLKALLTVGTACVTVSPAVAVLPVSGPAATIVPVVFAYAPIAAVETATLNVQVLSAGMDAPVSVTEPAPATGVNVPPQVFVETTGEATVIAPGASGKVSVNVTAVIRVGVPLVNVKFKVLLCPSCTGFGLNTLAIAGTPTDRMALAVVPVPALEVVTAPVLLV